MLPPRYVPVLTGKQGEVIALANLRLRDKAALTPLIDVAPIPRPHPPKKGDPPEAPRDPGLVLRKLLAGVAAARGDYDTMLDLTGFERYRPASQHPVEFAVSNMTGTPPIVVASNRSSSEYVDAVAAVNARLTGRAIRIHVRDATGDGATIDAARLAEELKTTPRGIDLIVDLGDVRDPDADFADADLSALLESLQARNWRSVTVAGTSLPQKVGLGGFSRVQRGEWSHWTRLQRSPVGHFVGFGDYGITGPRSDDDDPPYGPAPHLRYLAHDHALLVWKGRRSDPGEGGAIEAGRTYRDLCRELVDRSGYRRRSFAGKTFSWGDLRIWETAMGVRGTGGPREWVQYSTNHHLTMMLRHMEAYSLADAA